MSETTQQLQFKGYLSKSAWKVEANKQLFNRCNTKFKFKSHSSEKDRGKLEIKEAFITMLDKLFDILNYKCEVKLFSECEDPCSGGADCKHEVHISCSCSKDMKIPVKELVYI